MWKEYPTAVDGEEASRRLAGAGWPVAVTGGTGFIGVNLLESFVAAGLAPRVLLRDPGRLPGHLGSHVEVIEGDLEDGTALRRLVDGGAVVVHLAGLVRAASAEHFDRVNRVGTENLVAALAERAPAARLVYVSSLAAAGPSPFPEGRAPADDVAPVSAYGRSKLGGEEATRRHRGPWSILRPPAVYGPRDTDILQFFRLAARGIVPIPAGERWVTMVHVADVARAILAAVAGCCSGAVVHLGEPAPRPMRTLVEELAAAGGVTVRVVPVPPWLLRAAGKGGDLLHRLGARGIAMTSDKAEELLARHWTARTEESLLALGLHGYVPFSCGAAATWAWYRDHGWVARAKISGA